MDDNKKWFEMAENISRREYHKHFNVDLSNPGKLIYGPKSDILKLYNEVSQFWKDLLNRYDKQYNITTEDEIKRIFERQEKMSPLHKALGSICIISQAFVEREIINILLIT